jgi:UDP-N-acetylmuramyl pentapeptide phosphotransferase/UDP-N-acetylglucosamine-1-phosphate transferase
MTLALAALTGFLAARVLWLLLAPVFAHPTFRRLNFRERVVPTGAGVIVALVAIAGEAVRATAAAAGIGDAGTTSARVAVLVAVAGFALLGLIDDVAGVGEERGFRGHVGALLEGRLTTGGLKVLGGAAVAVVAVALFRQDSFAAFAADAGLVALAANLGNLFDRAPGRAIKVGTLAFVVLAILTSAPREVIPVAVVAGAGLGLLLGDLHERLMLGDAGANALGAALGIGVVATTSLTVRVLVLAVLAVLTILSERISFSKVIAATPPLRILDELGRRSPPAREAAH